MSTQKTNTKSNSIKQASTTWLSTIVASATPVLPEVVKQHLKVGIQKY